MRTAIALFAAYAVVAWLAFGWLACEVRALRARLERSSAADDAPWRLEGADDVCTHQAEHRTDSSTSGVYRWRCDPKKGGCGFVLERPATTGDYR